MYYILVVKMFDGIKDRRKRKKSQKKQDRQEEQRRLKEQDRQEKKNLEAETNEKNARANFYNKIDPNTSIGEKMAKKMMKEDTAKTMGEIEESIGKAFKNKDPFRYKANDAIYTAMSLVGDEKEGLRAYGAACRYGAETASRLGDEELRKDFEELARDYNDTLLEYYRMELKPEEKEEEKPEEESSTREEKRQRTEEETEEAEGELRYELMGYKIPPKDFGDEKEKMPRGKFYTREKKKGTSREEPPTRNKTDLENYIKKATYSDTGENIFYDMEKVGDSLKATFKDEDEKDVNVEYNMVTPETYAIRQDGFSRKISAYLLNTKNIERLVSEQK